MNLQSILFRWTQSVDVYTKHNERLGEAEDSTAHEPPSRILLHLGESRSSPSFRTSLACDAVRRTGEKLRSPRTDRGLV